MAAKVIKDQRLGIMKAFVLPNAFRSLILGLTTPLGGKLGWCWFLSRSFPGGEIQAPTGMGARSQDRAGGQIWTLPASCSLGVTHRARRLLLSQSCTCPLSLPPHQPRAMPRSQDFRGQEPQPPVKYSLMGEAARGPRYVTDEGGKGPCRQPCSPNWINFMWPRVYQSTSYSLYPSTFRFFCLFSPFAPSGAPMMQLLVHLTLFYRCLKLSSLLYLVLFSFSAAVIYTTLSFSSLIHSCHIYSIVPSNVFSFQLLYSSTLFNCSYTS